MTNVESILNIVDELKNMFAINEFDFLLYLLLIFLWVWLYNQVKKRDLFLETFQFEKGIKFIKDLYTLEQLLRNWKSDNGASESYQEASSNVAAIVSPSLFEKIKVVNENSSNEEIRILHKDINNLLRSMKDQFNLSNFFHAKETGLMPAIETFIIRNKFIVKPAIDASFITYIFIVSFLILINFLQQSSLFLQISNFIALIAVLTLFLNFAKLIDNIFKYKNFFRNNLKHIISFFVIMCIIIISAAKIPYQLGFFVFLLLIVYNVYFSVRILSHTNT